MEILSDGRSRIVVDASSLDLDAARRREAEVRIKADEAFAGRITTAEQRISAAEGRIGMLATTAAG
ncbi:hypothetical protein ASF59_11005 [Methylobacterium sp. Leaf121]|nr:hypothetical protein ASF59_11005 [Methylobacterium sp. Leaf121]